MEGIAERKVEEEEIEVERASTKTRETKRKYLVQNFPRTVSRDVTWKGRGFSGRRRIILHNRFCAVCAHTSANRNEFLSALVS